MSKRSSNVVISSQKVSKREQPSVSPKALVTQIKRVQSSKDFKSYMSALMTDLVTGAVMPQIANAACNAGGKLFEGSRDGTQVWEERNRSRMSYSAIISTITVRKHPNADRLQLGSTAGGNQVVVGLETQTGDIGIYFPTDGALSNHFCGHHNLYTQAASARLQAAGEFGNTDPSLCGFFDHRGKVRAQRFRGEKSDGFWVPLTYLSPWGDISTLKVGDTLTEFGGVTICEKFITKATREAGAKRSGRRGETRMFRKHVDTAQFRFYSDSIPDDAIITITEKLHGTSLRYGHVRDEIPLPWWKRWLNQLGPFFAPQYAWTYLNGSRNVILEKRTGEDYYGSDAFRYAATEGIELRKGEVLYGELVGWVPERRGDWNHEMQAYNTIPAFPIMDPQDVLKKELPEIHAQYGDTMTYKYGAPIGETRLFVYAISMFNEDGVEVPYSWSQVKGRCAELGLRHVPELAVYLAKDGNGAVGHVSLNSIWVDGLCHGPSTLDSTHMREGVVVRVDSASGTRFLKHKSWEFGVLEGYIKAKDTYVDTEEAA